jgi:hypothetical protein
LKLLFIPFEHNFILAVCLDIFILQGLARVDLLDDAEQLLVYGLAFGMNRSVLGSKLLADINFVLNAMGD